MEGAERYRRAGRSKHRTRADFGTEQNEKGNSDADPDEDLLVLLKELLDLVGRLLTELLAGILCGSPGSLRTGISSGGIFLLDALLLVVLVHVLLLHLRMLLLISLIACIIFSVFASSPPVVDPNAAPASMVWSYIGELIFNMLILVGAVKMAGRLVKEMMGI